MTTTDRSGAAETVQLLWRVRPATSPAGPLGRVGLAGPRCPGVVIEHIDGTEVCKLGAGCRGRLDDHDVGAACPGPEGGCPSCRSVFTRCDAPVIEHAPGDGTGALVCIAGHDADDLDVTDDADRAGQRVYHPGYDTYPCATPDCPRCAPAGPDTATV